MGKIILNGAVDDNDSYGAGENNVEQLDIAQINKAREELEAKELLLHAKEKINAPSSLGLFGSPGRPVYDSSGNTIGHLRRPRPRPRGRNNDDCVIL